MTAAAVLGEELTLKKLPFLTPEEVEDRLKDMGNQAMDRFTAPQNPTQDVDCGDDE